MKYKIPHRVAERSLALRTEVRGEPSSIRVIRYDKYNRIASRGSGILRCRGVKRIRRTDAKSRNDDRLRTRSKASSQCIRIGGVITLASDAFCYEPHPSHPLHLLCAVSS